MAKTKALISCAVTAQLILISVFAYAKKCFSHDEAHFIMSHAMRKTVLRLSVGLSVLLSTLSNMNIYTCQVANVFPSMNSYGATVFINQ